MEGRSPNSHHSDAVLVECGIDPVLLEFFGVDNRGQLVYKNKSNGHHEVDLTALMKGLRQQHGVRAPVILRFHAILSFTMQEIQEAFARALAAYGYRSRFQYVYPVKVCHRKSILQKIMGFQPHFEIGLEAGSRCEFTLCASLPEACGATIVYNGHKNMIDFEMAKYAQDTGRHPVLVFEDLEQLRLFIDFASGRSSLPPIALRLKLESPGAGRWSESSGPASKFGLSRKGVAVARDMLRTAGLLTTLTMLQFHLGSQMSRLQCIAEGTREAMKQFVHLKAQGATQLHCIDCGGGLAHRRSSSGGQAVNTADYTLWEYASTLVSTIVEACKDADIDHPKILLESGRAILSPHAVLVTERLSDRNGFTYCNFSLFRSALDIRLEPRKFPFVPLQGLSSRKSETVNIADLTGDSDGIVTCFPSPEGDMRISRPVENVTEFVAILDIGAYQEALGTAHNLFGTVDEVDIPDEFDGTSISSLVTRRGDSVADLLRKNGYDVDMWPEKFCELSTYPSKEMPPAVIALS